MKQQPDPTTTSWFEVTWYRSEGDDQEWFSIFDKTKCPVCGASGYCVGDPRKRFTDFGIIAQVHHARAEKAGLTGPPKQEPEAFITITV